ncbi:hypothetical protein VHEMI05445 [[Torrubiella] hemipterigena]|uniref:Uncharacterized protein n=1 Tax=[Torrubiella] hemipterigena TaxID=1531966 RepID=A0A0A1TGN6_9HYPO|nr:hypothetical protein VHEMI05445 [[Torrubiella] hemipterigena]
MFERLLLGVKLKTRKQPKRTESSRRGDDPELPNCTRRLPADGSPLLELPAEIRRLILLAAFGNQTIHIHKYFGYALINEEKPSEGRSWRSRTKAKRALPKPGASHCGITMPFRRDKSKPQAWRWFSCVCHRPTVVRPGDYFFTDIGRIHPGDDDCLGFGRGCVCITPEVVDGIEAFSPKDCFLGVSGWLQTCKLAYTEGMEILLSTNTIHLSSQHLIENLATELPIHQRTWIRSLEIRLDHGACDGAFSEDIPTTSAIWNIWDNLPQTCPGLQRLHITIYGFKEPQSKINDPQSRMARNVLTPLDALRLALPDSIDMTVSFEKRAYGALECLYRKIYGADGMESDPRNFRQGRERQIQDPYTFKKRITGTSDKYYWIEQGFSWPVMYVCTMGMGRGDEEDLWQQVVKITEDPVELKRKTPIQSCSSDAASAALLV